METSAMINTLDDENIKDVWAYHFSRRRESLASKTALIALIRLVSERAATCGEPETPAAAAHRFGIPLAEFDEFARER
jgi:hypothetical protein